MSEQEKVELDEASVAARFVHSDYAQVLFHNIAETYPVDKDLECCYTVTDLLAPTSRDWVALYKVGWSSVSRDYVTYNYAPMHDNTTTSSLSYQRVHFQAAKLPKDDGEFYQFCYVAGSGHVRGASTPFQFVTGRTAGEEFIEIEDEDNDIMVIRSRTAVLEDDLNKALQEEKNMRKTMELLERERDSLQLKLEDLQRECDMEREEKDEAQKDLRLTQEKVALCHQESAEMATYIKQLNEKLATVQQEKESIEARMNDNDTYVVSLRDKIKELVNTKDALMGKTRSLEEEKDMYKSNFSSSESTLTGYKVEIDNLKKQVATAEGQASQLQSEAEVLNKLLAEEKNKLAAQIAFRKTEEVQMQELTEKLRNCEDKLLAAEQCKQMLNQELDAVQQAYEKISNDMEQSKSEAFQCMMQISSLEQQSAQSTEKVKRLQEELHLETEAKLKLQEEVYALLQKFENIESEKKEENEAPLFALQMAQQTLKERLAKKHAENEEMKKVIEDLLARRKTWEQTDIDQKKEIVELKEHLLMGQETFRDKYVECQKLRADLKKALRAMDNSARTRSRSGSSTKELLQQVSMDSRMSRCEEQEVQSSNDKDADKADGTKDLTPDPPLSTSLNLSHDEMLQQMEQLGEELEKRKAGKTKYKNLFQEEKEKNRVIQTHYTDELTKTEARIQEVNDEWRKKYDVLQQRNVILTNDARKSMEAKELLEMEVERLMKVVERQGCNTQPPPPGYRYPSQEGAPVEPLPLRFGSPHTPIYPAQTMQPPTVQVCPFPPPPPPPAANEPPAAKFVPTLAQVAAVAAKAESMMPAPPPPLSPLPAPLQPELTNEAKKAAVLAATAPASSPAKDEVEVTAEDIFPEFEAKQPTPSAPVAPPMARQPTEQHDAVDGGEEERFQDAPGEPQQLCPDCQMTFPPGTEDEVFLMHIESHYGAVCPVCSTTFPRGHPSQDFEHHVNSHFDD